MSHLNSTKVFIGFRVYGLGFRVSRGRENWE